MNEYSVECIDKLRIHELRDFARNVGVASPTTMKKEELIAKIIEACDKNNKLDVVGALPKNKRGIDFFSLLMPENTSLLETMIQGKNVDLDVVSVEDESARMKCFPHVEDRSYGFDEEVNFDSYPEESSIFQFSVAQNKEAKYDASIVVEGYLHLHSTGYGIVRKEGYKPSNDDVYLSCEFVKRHALKSGDRVKGRAKAVIEDKPMIMFDIISVDGNPEQNKLVSFEYGKHNGLGDSFYFDRFNINIKKGERIYIKNLEYDYALKLAEDLIDDNNVGVKVLNIRAVPEDKDIQSREKLEVINCPFNMVDTNVISTVNLVLDRIKREFEDNKPNVLIVYNFSGLLRVLNTAVDGFLEYDKYDIRAINKVLDIMYSAKFVDNTHHFSIIFVDRNDINPVMKSVFETEFKPLFNSVIDAGADGFFN